ncbi:MAG: acyl-CoA thioesterase [Acidimicrobiia bacterium]
MAPTPFEQATAVQPRGEAGAYRAHIGQEWNCPVVPHGGLVTATVVRAMLAELDRPDQSLRSVTTVFAAQVIAGPVDVDVTVLRRGRSISQVSATARTPGADAGHATVAVFGAPRAGFEFTDTTAPVVPPPHECPSFRDPLPPDVDIVGDVHMNFWEQVEGRAASGHPPWEPYVPTTSERSAWYRFDEPPMLSDGRLDPLAVVTMCDTMPGAVSERMGRRDHRYLPPSCDLTVHLFDDARTEWILAVNRARYAGDGYASTEMEIWDASCERLVAYGTQQMFFVFPEGPPPLDERVPRTR